MNIKAKLPKQRVENGKMLDGKKEQTDYINVVAMQPAKRWNGSEWVAQSRLCNPITVRCWMGRSSNAHTVYCSIWVRTTEGDQYAGHGNAGGYGYHRTSAALQAAIDSAGIELFGLVCGNRDEKPDISKRAYIDGVGEQAMREALEAITRAAGYRGAILMTGL